MEVRPTSAKVRQAFFNILAGRIEGASFLDLFAGSGLMGFEALSRGASFVTFVDKNPRQIEAIENSVRLFQINSGMVERKTEDSLVFLEKFANKSYDIIFVDPPYRLGLAKPVLRLVGSRKVLKNGGVLVLEHLKGDLAFEEALCRETVAGAGFEKIDSRNYGGTSLSFFAYDGS
jgi:16S rRNA (guanine(966)-N(2))-methyltransferase RsmD